MSGTQRQGRSAPATAGDAPNSRLGLALRLAAAGCVAVMLASGCKSSGDDAEVRAGKDDAGVQDPHLTAPFELSSVAVQGSNVVALDSHRSEKGHRAAVRRADGMWEELPPLQIDGLLDLANAGDQVIAGGTERIDGSDRLRIAFAMLEPDRSGWRRLDAPNVEVEASNDEGYETWANKTRAPVALFEVGPAMYAVDPEGAVRPIVLGETPVGVSGTFGCFTGDWYIGIGYVDGPLGRPGDSFPPYRTMTGDVIVQRLDDPTSPAVSGGPAPEDFRTLGATFCAAGKVHIMSETEQAVYDIATGEWTRSPSNYVSAGGSVADIPQNGLVAASPDGSALFLVTHGTVLRSVDGEIWDQTGISAESVLSTDDGVFGITGRAITAVPED